LKSWDVIVVGGGPSGAFAARTCAEQGVRVLLIEKERPPRYKPCAGAVSQKTLQEIGDLPAHLVERTCFGGRLFSPSLQSTECRMPSATKLGVTTNRAALDYYLLEKAIRAGAAFHEGEPVRSFEARPDGAWLTTDKATYRAELVIGCDGANSTVARQAGLSSLPRDDRHYSVALETEISIGADSVEMILDPPDFLEFYFFSRFWGYAWVFPKREYISVGIGGLAAHLKKPREVFAGFLDDLGRLKGFDFKSHIEKVHGCIILLGGYDRPIVGERVLLAGDAASFLDPFLGEGIYYAVRSGKLAAQTAVEALQQGRTGAAFLSRYEENCRRAFADDFHWAWRFACFAYRFVELTFEAFARDWQLSAQFLQNTMLGGGSYQGFISWLTPHLPLTALRMLTHRDGN
jgi:geranylgeranyl reductase family protein